MEASVMRNVFERVDLSIGLSIVLVLINLVLGFNFTFGSIMFNPIMMIFIGQMLSRAYRHKATLPMVLIFLVLMLVNDLGLEFVMGDQFRETSMWLRIAALSGIVPALGMMAKTVNKSNAVLKRHKRQQLLLLIGVPLIYFASFFALVL